MNLKEKIEIARCLERMKVDIIEAGFAISSPGDFESVKTIAETVKDCSVASLARASKLDIDTAWDAVKSAAAPRIHLFLATSPVHMQYKLKMTPQQVLETTFAMTAHAKKYCSDVEFSAEDATRSDWDFLVKIVDAAIRAGATTVNIPDTVGYTTPSEMQALIEYLRKQVPDGNPVVLCGHQRNGHRPCCRAAGHGVEVKPDRMFFKSFSTWKSKGHPCKSLPPHKSVSTQYVPQKENARKSYPQGA